MLNGSNLALVGYKQTMGGKKGLSSSMQIVACIVKNGNGSARQTLPARCFQKIMWMYSDVTRSQLYEVLEGNGNAQGHQY